MAQIGIADKATLDLVKAKTDLIGAASPETGGTDELFKYFKLLQGLIGAANPASSGTDELFKYLKRLEENLMTTCIASATPQLVLMDTETLYSPGQPSLVSNALMPYTGTINIRISSKRAGGYDNAAWCTMKSTLGRGGVSDVSILQDAKVEHLNSTVNYIYQNFSLRVVAGCLIYIELRSNDSESASYVNHVSIAYTKQALLPLVTTL